MVNPNNGPKKIVLSKNGVEACKCIYVFFLFLCFPIFLGLFTLIVIISLTIIALFISSIAFIIVMRVYGSSVWFIGLCLFIFYLVFKKTKALDKIVFGM